MYHFFTTSENIGDGIIRISGSDVNHIKNVLRMKREDEILISDGAGTDYTCVISDISEEEILCDITGEGASLSEPSVKFYLFQGLPKSDKFEHIIQKAVELGVYEIIPVQTARSVVKYDGKKAAAKKERWQRIAQSAAKQSRRGIVPVVRDIITFSDAVKAVSSGEAFKTEIFCQDKKDSDGNIPDISGEVSELGNMPHVPEDGRTMSIIPYENFKDMQETRQILKCIVPGMSVGIFVGPEGGFEEKEVEMANEAGIRSISLGNRILRTETAPLMLLSVLTFALE